jgi:hypothetical protein
VANNNKVNNYPEYSTSKDPKDLPYGRDTDFSQSANQNDGFTTGNSSVEDYANQTARTWNRQADPNSWVFRYGLFFDNYSNLEDPTLLGFTVEIDDSNNSPLFADVTEPYSAAAFIEKYKGMPEIAARQTILTEFQNNIKMFFRSQESAKTKDSDIPYVKSHYINSISGLGNLSKKMVKYPEDQLTFNLYEDVTMHSQYLAQLYNNLSYSFRNQKTLIPENLLRFNLNIKISEVRNFKTVAKAILDTTNPEEQQQFVVNVNSSQLIYTLYDCNFLFFDSINHGEEISMAGLGGRAPEAKDLEMRLKYKYVNRFFKSTFLEDLNVHTNARIPMNDREYDPSTNLDEKAYFGDKVELKRSELNTGTTSDANRDKVTQLSGTVYDAAPGTDKFKYDKLESIKGGFVNNVKQLANNLKTAALGEVQKVENRVLEEIRRKKGELLNNLINQVRQNLGVVQITPKNVYYGPQGNILTDFGNQLGSGVANALGGFLRNVNNTFP